MARRPSKSSQKNVELDPQLFFPQGINNLTVRDDGAEDLTIEEPEEFGDEDFEDFDEQEGLPIPEGMVVEDQIVRITPGGRQVVDLVLWVDDLPGITDFEVRVTK